MDTRILNRSAFENETIIKKRFEKVNYMVERLDYQGPRPRPDLLISDSSGPRIICEVKTVFSGGYLTERDAHVSTRDSKLWDSGVFENQIDLTKIDDCLGDAVRKRTAFVADRPELKDLPLIVAFFFDFFADFLPFYPRDFGERFRDCVSLNPTTNQFNVKIISLIVIALCLSACQTTTQTTNRIAIGMTKAQVVAAVGTPHSKSAETRGGVLIEKWIYKETTWEQGGWSWNRTVSDSAIVFQNGHVVSYGVEGEQHLHKNPMNPDINVNVSHDD